VVFRFYRLRFRFRAAQPVRFPEGGAANTLRGGLGLAFRRLTCRPECPGAALCRERHNCAYARIFEPRAAIGRGPSGFADRPRPFVLRARHLDGLLVEAGGCFWFDLHLFTTSDPPVRQFVDSFAALAGEGLGRGRGRAALLSVEELDLAGAARSLIFEATRSGITLPAGPAEIELSAAESARSIQVRFLTPTELKSGGRPTQAPEFPILFARLRDRLSSLCAMYGEGPLEIDFGALGRKAEAIRMVRCQLGSVDAVRRSTRTGQVHPLGGFIGTAEYEGNLGIFLPYLRAGRWAGVGRQTVWGKGEIEVESGPGTPSSLQPRGGLPAIDR
jgi:hypothetical protein